jgi:glycosyl hydrolase family 53
MPGKDQKVRGGFRRRSVLLGAAADAGAVALGTTVLGGQAEAAAAFVKGADVSWLPPVEAKGYTWNDRNGTQRDPLSILKDYGITAVGLRTWVNPSSDPAKGHATSSSTTVRRPAGSRSAMGPTPASANRPAA